jgi:hypothetical protein
VSEEFHPGLHPDADVLGAFMEGALPEHERVVCLTHLAECGDCREMVSLMGHAAAVEEVKEKAPVRQGWLGPWTVVAMIVATVFVTFTIGLYRMVRSAETKPPVTASVQEQTDIEVPLTVKSAPEPVAKTKSRPAAVERAQPPQINAAAPPPPPPAAPRIALPQAEAAAAKVVDSGSEVVGTVTDRAGAVVANARIELKNESTGAAVDSKSDARGEFSIAGLTPGRYDMSVSALGFKTVEKPLVELRPQETARLDSTLDVGATSESVTVTAAAPLLQTESGAVAAEVPISPAKKLPLDGTLPNKSKPVSSAAKGRSVLATDQNGALFLSNNEGKSWKLVKGKWTGKVVRVLLTPDGRFQLTTDPASTWVSADGRKWSQVR